MTQKQRRARRRHRTRRNEVIKNLAVAIIFIGSIVFAISMMRKAAPQTVSAVNDEEPLVTANLAAMLPDPTTAPVYKAEVILEPDETPATDPVITAGSVETAEEEEVYIPEVKREITPSDADILIRIAMAEAEGEDTEGKALVMLVVLNRVWTEDFPNSIDGVVMQHSGDCYQFSTVTPGGRYWTTEPNEDCVRALEMVMYDGWDESQGATFFEATYSESTWHRNHLKRLFEHGGHIFYKIPD